MVQSCFAQLPKVLYEGPHRSPSPPSPLTAHPHRLVIPLPKLVDLEHKAGSYWWRTCSFLVRQVCILKIIRIVTICIHIDQRRGRRYRVDQCKQEDWHKHPDYQATRYTEGHELCRSLLPPGGVCDQWRQETDSDFWPRWVTIGIISFHALLLALVCHNLEVIIWALSGSDAFYALSFASSGMH